SAAAILEPMDSHLPNRNVLLADVYAEQGQYARAADTLLLYRNGPDPRPIVEEAARLLRTAPAKVDSPQSLPEFPGDLRFVYAHIGAMDRVMEFADRGRKIGRTTPTGLWGGVYAPLRKTEWFKTLIRDSGLVEYWRASRRIPGPELTIITLLLVASSLLFFVFVRPSPQIAAGPTVQQAGVTAARLASANKVGAISIAVLPFSNLSGDSAQEFFSDGM